MIKSLSPADPRGTDPRGFPWVGVAVWVLALVVMLFGGSRVVERIWGTAAALGSQVLVSSVWLVGVALWLAVRGGGKRG